MGFDTYDRSFSARYPFENRDLLLPVFTKEKAIVQNDIYTTLEELKSKTGEIR